MSAVIAGLPVRVYTEDVENSYLHEISKDMDALVDKPTFYLSQPTTFTIPSGASGAAVTPADLYHNCKLIVISCADCSGVAASTSLTVQTGFGASDTMCTLYEQDTPSLVWTSGNLPTSGTMRFALTHAIGARRVRLILSNNTTTNTVFTIYGVDVGQSYA